MSGNRKAFIDFILSTLEAILPGNTDVPRYKAYLESLSDEEMKEYAQALRSGDKYLTLTAPNGHGASLSLERNMDVAKQLGVNFFHRLWIEGRENQPSYLTPVEYMVVKLPVRLASQRIAKKMSIPKNQRAINAMTGQVTGDSKGAGISHPELRVLASLGLEKTLVELMKYRGGDLRGNAALNASLMKTGRATQETLQHFASGVESTRTLKTYLTSAMLKNTL
jgi:hypothetical protein